MRCLTPITVRRDAAGYRTKVRCGRCQGCQVSRQTSWSLRLLAEAQSHPYARFLTLTYREESLPPALDYRDIQLFLKRWRKNFPGVIRFFCSGEYGTRTKRPHWHLMIFTTPRPPVDLGLGSVIHPEWDKGFCFVGALSLQSALYTAKYALKNPVKGEPSVHGMSRRPGLGLPYFTMLGRHYAERVPFIEQVPNTIKFGSRLLTVDRTAKDRFEAGYLAAGGALGVGRSREVSHMVAVAYEQFGVGRDDAFNESLYRKALILGPEAEAAAADGR